MRGGLTKPVLGIGKLPFLYNPIQSVHAWTSDDTEDIKASVPLGMSSSVDFGNYEDAYAGHSSLGMLRSLAVLNLCRSEMIVNNANKIMNTSRTFIGDTLTHSVVRHSFFNQFCPGTSGDEALKSMHLMSAHGIGCIFDWVPATTPSQTTGHDFHVAVDDNMKTIIKGIECAALDTETRMAAVKLATITRVDMLEKVTRLIRHLHSENLFPEHKSLAEKLNAYLSQKRDETHELDLDEDDMTELNHLKWRVESLASIASRKGVRLLIDAEETEVQPAIDYVALSAMETFNTSKAWIWNTYQCYLKDAQSRLLRDMQHLLSKRCAFGVKLVRGAYLNHETERAVKLNLPSPIFSSQSETDVCYNDSMRVLLDGIRSGEDIGLCLATHNQESIEAALAHMRSLKLDRREAPVFFAQIYGMRDYLTYTLGHHDYKALKLLMFGDVQHVMPYLVRRAQENSSILGGSQRDSEAMKAVLKSRAMGLLGIRPH